MNANIKGPKKKRRISWFSNRKKSAYQYGTKAKTKGKKVWQKKGSAGTSIFRGSIHAAQGIGKAGEAYGKALPGPFQVWTLAWQKTSRALKTLSVLVFAVVLLFVPWGVVIYTGWAVGAAFMFLIALIFWVFVNLFGGIGSALVAGINGLFSIVMGSIIYVVEAIFNALNIGTVWQNGRDLLENSLINLDQIANVPSLYHIVTPEWRPEYNTTIISKILEVLGIQTDFTMFSDKFKEFYISLSPEYAVIIGLAIVAIPIVYLLVVYYKNRYQIYG